MDKQTDIKIGFKTNTQELKKASEGVKNLQKDLKNLQGSEGGGEVLQSPLGRIRNYVTGRGGSKGGIGQKLVQKGFSGGMRGAAAGLGALGLAGGIIGVMAKSISLGKEFTQTAGSMAKALDLGEGSFDNLTDRIKENADALRIGMNELGRYNKMYLRAAGGQGGANQMMRQVQTAGLFARGYGLDVGETVNQFGSLGQAGVFGKMGSISAKEFSMYLAEAINGGEMRGRENEVLQSFQTIAESQLGVLTRISNMDFFSDLLTGMNKTGQPGLMGMRGAGVLSRLDSGLRNPRGELGELMMWQSMGGAEKNGSYFDFKYQLEGGLKNLPQVQKWAKKQGWDQKQLLYYLSEMLGVSMHQVEGTLSATGEMGSSKKFANFMKKIGLNGQNKEMSAVMNQVFNADNDDDIRKILVESDRFRKTDIDGIMSGGNRADILRNMSKSEMNLSTLDEQQKAFSSIENSLTETGTVLIGGLATSVNFLSEGIEKAAKAFIKVEGWASNFSIAASKFGDAVEKFQEKTAGNSQGKYHATDLLGKPRKMAFNPGQNRPNQLRLIIENKTDLKISNGSAPNNKNLMNV